MAIDFGGFLLQDENYIVSEITYRGGPKRELQGQKVTRRPGVKYTTNEFGERTISLQGAILGSSVGDLRDKIDALFTNVVNQLEGLLSVESDRSIKAIVSNISIEDPHYNQTYVPYSMDFVASEPFFKSQQQTVNLDISTGGETYTYMITISGTAYAEPTITYIAPNTSTTTSGVSVSYTDTGEIITWSGTGLTPTLSNGNALVFDWGSQIVTKDGVSEEPVGVFPRWEPGEKAFSVTFSGTQSGGTLQFSYQPRYY